MCGEIKEESSCRTNLFFVWQISGVAAQNNVFGERDITNARDCGKFHKEIGQQVPDVPVKFATILRIFYSMSLSAKTTTTTFAFLRWIRHTKNRLDLYTYQNLRMKVASMLRFFQNPDFFDLNGGTRRI